MLEWIVLIKKVKPEVVTPGWSVVDMRKETTGSGDGALESCSELINRVVY